MDLKPYLVKSSRSLKGSSINNYVRNIKTLHGGEPFEDLNWLTDTAAILEKIKGYSQTTQRNMLTSAIVVLKAVDEEQFKETLQAYKERLLLLNGAINKSYSEKKKTSKEKSNWVETGRVEGHPRPVRPTSEEPKHRREDRTQCQRHQVAPVLHD